MTDALFESSIKSLPRLHRGKVRDIYIALGEPLGENAWGVRVYFKPFIRWIWAGGFMILFGGILALADRRYYQKTLPLRVNSQEVRV